MRPVLLEPGSGHGDPGEGDGGSGGIGTGGIGGGGIFDPTGPVVTPVVPGTPRPPSGYHFDTDGNIVIDAPTTQSDQGNVGAPTSGAATAGDPFGAFLNMLSQPLIGGIPVWVFLAAGGVVLYMNWPLGGKKR